MQYFAKLSLNEACYQVAECTESFCKRIRIEIKTILSCSNTVHHTKNARKEL